MHTQRFNRANLFNYATTYDLCPGPNAIQMRVSRPNLINVALFIKFLVKSGELEFVKVTNDEENFHLQKRLKNSIEKASYDTSADHLLE